MARDVSAAAAVVLALSMVWAVPATADAAAGLDGCDADAGCPIRPGARMTAPSRCTFNWVLDGSDDRVYIGTAGHCVDGTGQRVAVRGVDGTFGEVAWKPGGLWSGVDFALVRVDEGLDDRVRATTRGIGGPTGVFRPPGSGITVGPATPWTSPGPPEVPDANTGLPVVFHGHGTGWADDPGKRNRSAVAYRVDATSYELVGPITGGDSGAPIQVAGAGSALGIVSANAGLLLQGQPPEPVRDAAGLGGPVDRQVSGPLLAHVLDVADEELPFDLTLRRGAPVDGPT